MKVLCDGLPDRAALRGRLQRHECPYLEIVDDAGATLAASYAAIEEKGDPVRALAQADARLATLLRRAALGERGPLPPRPERPMARYGKWRALRAAARRRAGRLLARLRGDGVRHGHWTVALRRAPEAAAPDRFDLADWTPLPADPDVFHADPFLFEEGGRTWLFAEAYPYAAGKGEIVCARVSAEGEAGPLRTVLAKPWHLSYPFVFRAEGQLWLMPESAARGGVDLYRAEAFPDRWVLERTLFEGRPLVDATLFEHEGRLWLFAGEGWDELFAWHAPSLAGPWTPHALTPLKSDCRGARPGGRVIRAGGRLLRPGQICEHRYGEGLTWFEIARLTPDEYEERPVAQWRAAAPCSGPHTADLAGPIQAIDYRLDLRR